MGDGGGDRDAPPDSEVGARVAATITRASACLPRIANAPPGAVADFFGRAIELLRTPGVVETIARVNELEVQSAKARGRGTSRLMFDDSTVNGMLDALAKLRVVGDRRNEVLGRHEHDGFVVETVRSALGVVGFVFEGRPNVVIDATGVLAAGNAAVLRIGSDALETAKAIHSSIVAPALAASGLPTDAIVLLDEPSHEAASALFSDRRIALGVARGSGAVVRELGEVARRHSIPVSLHGTGGAWMLLDDTAQAGRVRSAVANSLDRKVCNTLNVCCVPRGSANRLLPAVLEGMVAAVSGRVPIVHAGSDVRDASGLCRDVEWADPGPLSEEWEWDERPECSVVLVDDIDHGITLCNEWSPRFVVSVIGSEESVARAWSSVDAPFVGDGMSRWVDGQYALSRPELGLSNWEHGRMLGRGAILSGVDVHSIRYRMRQSDPRLRR